MFRNTTLVNLYIQQYLELLLNYDIAYKLIFRDCNCTVSFLILKILLSVGTYGTRSDDGCLKEATLIQRVKHIP